MKRYFIIGQNVPAHIFTACYLLFIDIVVPYLLIRAIIRRDFGHKIFERTLIARTLT